MTATSDAKPLDLTVTNFGPIAEAKIQLRPMTVFVGPSNTGKSYMATLIYALHKAFNGYSGDPTSKRTLPEQFWDDRDTKPRGRTASFSKEDVANLSNWFNEMMTRINSTQGGKVDSFELPKSVDALVRPKMNDVSSLGDELDGEIARCFRVDQTKDLCRYPTVQDARFQVQGEMPTEGKNTAPFAYDVTLTTKGAELSNTIPSTAILRLGRDDLEKSLRSYWPLSENWTDDEPMRVFGCFHLVFALAKGATAFMVDPIDSPAYYLPADRAGVMHSHQVIVRALIAVASRPAPRPDSPSPVLSGVLGDFLDQLVALASYSPLAHQDYDALAKRLERTLLRGSVLVEGSDQINYPSLSYRPIGWERDLPLMNSSSMISELTPVVLYLRYVVQPGDLLIIEEPEAHLHPEMQAAFTRILASAVQSGIRILITTHSEWILEELANLVRLSELPKERRVGIENEDIALRPDQLGAWFFEPNEEEGGSVVREISLDEESATFPAGFGLVTESLYNRWAEISSRIQEG